MTITSTGRYPRRDENPPEDQGGPRGRGGIVCASCTDSTIESNTGQGVAATGISLSGQRITVRRNPVIGTVAGGDSAADGVRFFGNGHRITSNTIRDISASGYPTPPHPACLHTFDTGRPATFDVEIVGNACSNVDEHCLIATDDEGGNGDAPTGSRSITFTGNTCARPDKVIFDLNGTKRAERSNSSVDGYS